MKYCKERGGEETGLKREKTGEEDDEQAFYLSKPASRLNQVVNRFNQVVNRFTGRNIAVSHLLIAG